MDERMYDGKDSGWKEEWKDVQMDGRMNDVRMGG